MVVLEKLSMPMSSNPTPNDVVFVVEGTALCGAYLNELKQAYIVPTLEYFNGGPMDEKDCGSDSNYTVYGLVVFHAADILPGYLTEAYGPITTPHKLVTMLDKIQFAGGHGEAASHIGEGLATALQCLQDITSFRNPPLDIPAKKHVILICNCKPYGLPVTESVGPDAVYRGMTADQLASQMLERGVHLSIMSPRKIPALISLFDRGGGESSTQKTYAREVRHLVLLNGYHLQERPITPKQVAEVPSGPMIPPPPPQIPQPSTAPPPPPVTVPQPMPHPLSMPPQQVPMPSQSQPPSTVGPPQPPPPIPVQAPQAPPQPMAPQMPISSVPTSMQQTPPTMTQMSQAGMNVQPPMPQQTQAPMPPMMMNQQAPGMGMNPPPHQVPNPQQPHPSMIVIRNRMPLQSIRQMQLQQSHQQQLQQQQPNPNQPLNPQLNHPMNQPLNPGPQGPQPMNPQMLSSQQLGPTQVAQQMQQLQQQQQHQQMTQQLQNQQQQQMNQQPPPGMSPQLQQQQQQTPQQLPPQFQNQQAMQQQMNQQMGQQGMPQQLKQPMLGQQIMGGQLTPQQQQLVMQQQQQQQQNQPPQTQAQQPPTSMARWPSPMPPVTGMQRMQAQAALVRMSNVNQPGQVTSTTQNLQAQMTTQQPILSTGISPNLLQQQQQQQAQQPKVQPPPQQPPQQQGHSTLLAQLQNPPQPAQAPPSGLLTGPQAMNNQKERQNIWSGTLEWHEKQKGPPDGQKIPRQVPCKVSAYVVNGEPEVKGDGWPPKLIMQLIPKNIVGSLGGSFLVRDVKTVVFMLQNCDALNSLTRVMDSGYAGCVHFTGAGLQQNACAIKVLILLYSKERQTYLGFIPNDQAGFVDRIRKVIQQQKQQQQSTRQGQVFPGGAPGLPQQNMMQGPQPVMPQQPGLVPGPQGSMVQPQQGMLQTSQAQGMVSQQQQPQMVQAQQTPISSLAQQLQATGGMGQSQVSALAQQLGQAQQLQQQQQQQVQQVQQSLQQGNMDSTGQTQAELAQMEMERQQNLLKIQQLQQTLQAAQQKELQFQQLQSHPVPGQMQQGQGPPPPGPSPMQVQVSQQQLLQPGPLQQMQQVGRPMMTAQQMGQMRMMRSSVSQANPGLKHLLQQQPGPQNYRMQMPMQQQGMQGGMQMQGQMQGGPMQQPNQQVQQQQFEEVGILDLLK